MSTKGQIWQQLKPRLSVYEQLPTPVFMKAKEMSALTQIVDHQHNWDQLIVALTGVLEVNCENMHYIIPPQQAVWIPANKKHNIATVNGAQLRSIHFNKGLITAHKMKLRVLKISTLVKELLNTASQFEYKPDMSEIQQRLLDVLIDQVNGLPEVHLCLPLSNDPLLSSILSCLQSSPDNANTLQQWSIELGASSKTIARRFHTELGMTFSQWREQLKLHRAIQWLHEKRPITQISLELGYDSLSAFIQMFKRNMGVTPGKFNQS